jgi:hypothetical protein
VVNIEIKTYVVVKKKRERERRKCNVTFLGLATVTVKLLSFGV